MPFTGSHPAAVLPLLRTSLPASALVAGSIAPDVPFYLPVELPWATHTALAVVTVDLLVAALAWALWHALLAPAALSAAPAGVRGRLAGVPLGLRRRLRSARAGALVLGALLLGAAVHVLVAIAGTALAAADDLVTTQRALASTAALGASPATLEQVQRRRLQVVTVTPLAAGVLLGAVGYPAPLSPVILPPSLVSIGVLPVAVLLACAAVVRTLRSRTRLAADPSSLRVA